MIVRLLKAKHWQLFLLTFGIPILVQIISMFLLFSSMLNQPGQHTGLIVIYMRYLPFVMTIFMGVYFAWFWAVAIGLQTKVPEGVKMKVTKFKVFFLIPLIYIFLIMASMFYALPDILDLGSSPTAPLLGSLLAVIVPLHLFSIFCILYSLYFIAKTFKTVELQREVSFSDFAGEFFLVWFYPIGIWIIQPKINKMIEE